MDLDDGWEEEIMTVDGSRGRYMFIVDACLQALTFPDSISEILCTMRGECGP